ncbi:MAG: hypothetical protein LBL46_04075 [Rickettsiales bacterium]|jgi:hypothetical protein|nr:hypothetical protein [Rickettsiales bacterium]
MKISQVKTAFKIADVKIKSGDVLDFIYLPKIIDEKGNGLATDILKRNIGRVYIIAVNGIIKKIGGSEDKGGMKGTLNIYKTGGLNGQPSQRSIGVWWHLFHELSDGKKIEIYMIYQQDFVGSVKGLFGETEQKVSISYKHIENACLADFHKTEKKYPDWNYQENHEPWEAEIDELERICKYNKGKAGKIKIHDIGGELKKRGFAKTKIVRNYK